ncbi:Ig-like domain-containing protein [Mesorhizobium sp. M0615]
MLAGDGLDGGSVLNLANYTLVKGTGEPVALEVATYDVATRTVRLSFDPLEFGDYTLTVGEHLKSIQDAELGSAFTSDFTAITDLSALVTIEFSAVRSSRADGTVSYDVKVTNICDADILAPLTLVLDPAQYFLGQPAGATFEGGGLWYINLGEALADGRLAPGQSTTVQTVTIGNSALQHLSIGHGVFAVPAANRAPVIDSAPVTTAIAGQPYSYQLAAHDPDGNPFTYLLLDGAEGMGLSNTGLLTWSPTVDSPAQVSVVLRAYDNRGSYATQAYAIQVDGGNQAPVIQELPEELRVREGENFAVGLAAFDPDGDYLQYFADQLPAGASLNGETGLLQWTPGWGQAGTYEGVVLGVTDGVNTVARTFTLLVEPTNQAPSLTPVPDRIVREGDPIRIRLRANDAEGDALVFSSALLPGGAFLDPNTGAFEWTPSFTQAGTYVIPFLVSDGINTTEISTTFTVANANGAPAFDELGPFRLLENQPLFFRAFAFDPDNPGFVPQDRKADGSLTPLDGTAPTVSYGVENLPQGASFDPVTGIFGWIPGYTQAGHYTVRFTATDTGDGLTPAVTVRDVVIDIVNANRAPVVPTPVNQSVNRGEILKIPVEVSDPDGDPLTWSVYLSRQPTAGGPAVDTTPIELTALGGLATFVKTEANKGIIRFAPVDHDRGNYLITIRATDDGGAEGKADIRTTAVSFITTVVAPNERPLFDIIGDKVAVPGQALSFILRARDPDQTGLVFSGENMPAGMTITPLATYGTARVDWTPTAADIGERTITFQVTDDGNAGAYAALFDRQSISLVVRASNAAPVLLPIGDRTLREGEAFALSLQAIDPDNDAITFSVTNLPTGASFNAKTGLLSWTPNFFTAGDYLGITFTASDGNKASSETITLKVQNVNRAPELVPIFPQAGREAAEMAFTLLSGDVDQDPVVYSVLSPLPQGARFDRKTGKFTWTPGYSQAGDYTIRFGATDPSGALSTLDVQVAIADTNRTPVLKSSDHQVVLGTELVFRLAGTDPDTQNTLTYGATGLPEGATLNETTGEIRWTPGPGQAGDYLVLATLSDGQESVLEPVVLRATTAPDLPRIVIEQTPSFPVVPGQEILVHVIATGFADITKLEVRYNGNLLALDGQGRARIPVGLPGLSEIVATATDADGLVGTRTAILKVRDPADILAPQVSFAAGLLGRRFDAKADVVGSVIDTNLDRWQLEIAHFGSGKWTTLATGAGAITNSALAQLDPALFANGIYSLRLTAADVAGRTARAETQVEIDSIKALPRAENDLTVTLAGHQIALVRHYDPLARAQAGSFGNGWQLALKDVAIETDVPPTGREALGSYGAFRNGTRVYVTLPTGERVGFTFEAQEHRIPGLVYYTPSFRADAGVTWTLQTAATQLSRVGDRFYDLATGRPYNPAGLDTRGEYQLVGPDGTAYVVDSQAGVTSIRFTDGVALTVADSGIFAPNGDGVSFIGGEHGITRAITTDGRSFAYLYDAQGNLTLVRNLITATSRRYGYDADHRLTLVSGDAGQPGVAIDAAGAELPVTADLGVATGYLADAAHETLTQGGTNRLTFTIRPSELESTDGGSLYLGVILKPTSGGATFAVPELQGATLVASRAGANGAFALYKIDQAGLKLLTVRGADAESAGAYSLELFVAGDANRDGKVDGTDAALTFAANGASAGQAGYTPTADANQDGTVDSTDAQLLFQNLGYQPNQAPIAITGTFKTHQELELTASIGNLVSDPEADTTFVRLLGATHGTARLSADGKSIVFVPEAGFAGQASFTIVADDGYQNSAPVTISVSVSDAALLRFDFVTRQPRINLSERYQMQWIGDFADESNVLLPASYFNVSTTNPVAADVSGGMLIGRASGAGTVVSSRGRLTAATAFLVGSAQTYEDYLLATLGADVYPDAVTLAANGGTRQIKLFTDPQDASTNVAFAANGTRYYVDKPGVVEVSPDGLITALASGEVTITATYKMAEARVPVRVVAAQLGPTLVGEAGAVVVTGEGLQVAIAPGALSREVTVTISGVARDDLTIPVLPEDQGFRFGAAFHIDLQGATLDAPAQLVIPTTLEPGSAVRFYRLSDFATADGTVQGWLEVESGYVDANGFARTASPIWSGIGFGGTYMAAAIDPAMIGTVVADLGASFGTIQQYAYTNIGNVLVGAAGLGQFPLSLPGGNQNITLSARAVDGHLVRTTTNVDVRPGEVSTVETTFSVDFEPVADTHHSPTITSARVEFADKGRGIEPWLVLKGDRFVWSEPGAPTLTGTDLDHLRVLFGYADELEIRDLIRGHEADEAIPVSKGVLVRPSFMEGGELWVRAPNSIALGSTPFQVGRLNYVLTNDELTGERSSYARDSGQTGSFWDALTVYSNWEFLDPGEENVFVAVPGGTFENGTADQLAVIRQVANDNNELPELVARIPLGNLEDNGRPVAGNAVMPNRVAITSDKARAYVTLRSGGIAVVDTMLMRQVDVLPDDPAKPNTDGVNFIKFINAPNAAPWDIAIDASDKWAYVSDMNNGAIYVIDVDPASATYNKHVGTIVVKDVTDMSSGVPQHFGLRDLKLTPDGRQLVVAAPNQFLTGTSTATTPGKLIIVDLPDPKALLAIAGAVGPIFSQVHSTEFSAPGLEELFAVRTLVGPKGEEFIAVTDRSSDGTGLVVLKKDGSTWKLHSNISITLDSPFGPDNFDSFDVNNASDVVFTDDLRYGFVYGYNRFVQGVDSHDPDANPNEPAGSNIGVIRDPFGLYPAMTGPKGLVAATRMIPYAFGSSVALSADGKYLYGTYTGNGAVLVFDVTALIAQVENSLQHPVGARSPTYNWAIDDLTSNATLFDPFTGLRTGVNSLIDVRADFAVWSGVTRPSAPNSPNAPIYLGGTPRGMASQQSPHLFSPEADPVNFNALRLDQMAAIADDADIYDGLGGDDVVTLPNQANQNEDVGNGSTLGWNYENTFYAGPGNDTVAVPSDFGGAGIVQAVDGGTETDRDKSNNKINNGLDILRLPGRPNDYTFDVKFNDHGATWTQTVVQIRSSVNPSASFGVNSTDFEKVTFDDLINNSIELTGGSVAVEMMQLNDEVYGSIPTLNGKKEELLAFAEGATDNTNLTAAAVSRKWHTISAMELGLLPADYDPNGMLHYSFVNGIYAAIDSKETLLGDHAEANAMVLTGIVDGRRTLEISFRGTDQTSDFLDYVPFQKHLDKFKPLLDAVVAYLDDPTNGIQKVLIGGHSLGGSVAQLFTQQLLSTRCPTYVVSTYTDGSPGAESPRKGLPITNFVHTDDLVGNWVPTLSSPAAKAAILSLVAAGDIMTNGVAVPFIRAALAEKGVPLAQQDSLLFSAVFTPQKEHSGSVVYFSTSVGSLLDMYNFAEHNRKSYTNDLSFIIDFVRDNPSSQFSKTDFARSLLADTLYSGKDIQVGIAGNSGDPNEAFSSNVVRMSNNDDFDLGGQFGDVFYWAGGAKTHIVDGGVVAGFTGSNTLVIEAARPEHRIFSWQTVGDHIELTQSDGVHEISWLYNIQIISYRDGNVRYDVDLSQTPSGSIAELLRGTIGTRSVVIGSLLSPGNSGDMYLPPREATVSALGSDMASDWVVSDLEALAESSWVGSLEPPPGALQSAVWSFGDLSESQLAESTSVAITLDSNAAGFGWFVDPTPRDNSEFESTAEPNVFLARAGTDASSRIDLLTAAIHEVGHILGLGHSPDPNSVMFASLPVGVRRLPSAADVEALKAVLAAAPEESVASALEAEFHLNALLAELGPGGTAPAGINWSFGVSDPNTGSSGWIVTGGAGIGSGVLTLSESDRVGARATQEFSVPQNTLALRFKLKGVHFGDSSQNPGDAFEFALIGSDGKPIAVDGLSRTDAALNIQSDGTVFASSRIRLTGLDQNGKLPPDAAVTVEFDLTGIPADTPLKLYFDLLGFGALGSQVIIDDVEFVTEGQPGNHAPIASDDEAMVAEDGSVVVAVLANDTDEDGDTLTPSVVTEPANGTVTLNPGGSFTYAPKTNFFGADSFTYRVSDGFAQSNVATVTLTVTPVNDAPVATDDIASVTEDGSLILAVLGNDSDVDGDALTPVLVTGPANGTLTLNLNGSFTYAPTANFSGTDSFTYKASDGTAESNIATVTLTVTPVNDAPVAADDLASVAEGGSVAVSVLANDTDVDGDALSPILVTEPTNGTLTLNSDRSFTYAPKANFSGTDSFTYKSSDGSAESNIATVALTINAANQNHAPLAIGDMATAAEDGSVVVPVLTNDSDVDGDSLTPILVTGPTNGTLTLNPDGSFTYAPNANFFGTDSFTYKASDGIAESNIAIVALTITPVNDAPVAADDLASVAEGGSLVVSVLTNDSDVDGDTLTPVLVSGPTNGTLTLNPDGSFTYAPNANFFGTDSFTYKAFDGTAESNIATVALTVTPVNDAPVAADDIAYVAEDGSLVVLVLANDSDVDGDTLTPVLVAGPTNGTLTLNPDGSFTYAPKTNFFGTDSFTYQASDGVLASNIATVRIEVTAGNNTPVLEQEIADQASPEDALWTFTLPALVFKDPDGDALTLSATIATGEPLPGWLSFDASTLTFSGTPPLNFNGVLGLKVTASDGELSAFDTFNLTVTPVNDAPVAQDVAGEAMEDGPAVLLAPIFADVDQGDTHSISFDTAGTVGKVILNANSTFTYDPNGAFDHLAAGATAQDVFIYTVRDAAGAASTATVTVSITGQNDGPKAVDDSAATDQNTALSVAAAQGILANDTDPDSGDTLALFAVNGSAANIGQVLALVSGARVAVKSDGSYDYDPNGAFAALAAGETASDSFTYTVKDASGALSTARVTIAVNGLNDGPSLAALSDRSLKEGETVAFVPVASDPDRGDKLVFSLVTAPAGAMVDPDTGAFRWTARDGDATHNVTLRVTDAHGAASEQSFAIHVADVAPTITVTGPAHAIAGDPYTITLGAADPGDDTITLWRVDWGDGLVDSLAGSATTATHDYDTRGGFTILASATNEDGTFSASSGTSVVVDTDWLVVQSFTPTATGFRVRFNHAFDPSTFNIHPGEGNARGPTDVMLIGQGVGRIDGSIVIDDDLAGFTFLRTGAIRQYGSQNASPESMLKHSQEPTAKDPGTAQLPDLNVGGILPFDHYRVMLRSGENSLHDSRDDLDGNRDGTPGDDFIAGFDVKSVGNGIISLFDFMRGPGQKVDVPARANGLPVSFSSLGGVKSLVFTVDYDPALLTITGATAGADLPKGTKLTFGSTLKPDGTKQATVTVSSSSALRSGTLNIVSLIASVPSTAIYGDTQILHVAVASVNGKATTTTSDDALQVVGYIGDANRDAAYTKADVKLISGAAANPGQGFAAWSLIDPVSIADFDLSGAVTSQDANILQSEIAGRDQPEIPPIPSGIHVQLQSTGAGLQSEFSALGAWPLGPIPTSANTTTSQSRVALGEASADPTPAKNSAPLSRAPEKGTEASPLEVPDWQFGGAARRASPDDRDFALDLTIPAFANDKWSLLTDQVAWQFPFVAQALAAQNPNAGIRVSASTGPGKRN